MENQIRMIKICHFISVCEFSYFFFFLNCLFKLIDVIWVLINLFLINVCIDCFFVFFQFLFEPCFGKFTLIYKFPPFYHTFKHQIKKYLII